MHALIIDDEPDIAEAVAQALQRIDIESTTVQDGQEGFDAALTDAYDLIVLDLLLPSRNGFDICRSLRAAGIATPILCLSAKSGEFDEIEALELGADDYLRKPFSVDLLQARIVALMRRPRTTADAAAYAGIRYDASTREAEVEGSAVHLTPREGQVLAQLIQAGDRPLSKNELLSKVWGDGYGGNPNVVEVYIRYLRQKLGRDRVDTIPRTGYRLRQNP
ncbi:MAG: response regulator transcription factor [Acidimicrobiales bacterium]|nr:response regulator transcription factor [Acidimicrobiales bacterium]